MADLKLSNGARADIRRDAERNAEGATVGDTLRLLGDCEALIAENERLQRIEESWSEWLEKTEWVQRTAEPKELGMHRADILRKRVDRLQADLERLQEQQKPAGGAGAAENCRCNEKLQVVQAMQAELERVRAEGLALLVMARPFLAARLSELPYIRNQVGNPDAIDRAIEKLSALVSHIDAAMGKGGRADGQ